MQGRKIINKGRGPSMALGLFLCLLVFVLAGCDQQDNTLDGPNAPLAVNQQTGVFPAVGENSQSDFTSLDPARASDHASAQVTSMAFTGLVSLDSHLQVKPQLAESYTSSDNGLTWTFKLKPNLKFSDGTRLTSQDVVYSLDRALQPLTASSTASTFLGSIKDADKLRRGE